MHRAIIISRVLVASVAIWRLSHLFFEGRNYAGRSRCFSPRPENIFANRLLDCVCWLSVWLSAQTAIWVVGGLAGVLVNWLLFSSLSRLFVSANDTSNGLQAELRSDAASEGLSRFSVERTLQANHG